MNASSPLDPVVLARQLCEIESTTYHEGPVAEFLADLLAQRGWDVEKTLVEPPSEQHLVRGPRWNVYAGKSGEAPDLVFSTHLDTVPPYIPFSEDEEFIYGRGVCDAKGILAAQVVAAEALRADGFKIGMLFVVGEERDSAGAYTANKAPKGGRYLINGEPTDNRIALGSKGALRAWIRCHGRAAHSAYPELGESAIDKLVAILDRLLKTPLAENPEIGPSTLNIGQISGGQAPNIVADYAEAQVLIRTVTESEPVRRQIVETVGADGEVEFTLDMPFVKLKAVEGLPTMVAKFSTDIPGLTNWGEPLLIGPGSIHVAHRPDEKLAKKELCEAVEIYKKIGRQLLG